MKEKGFAFILIAVILSILMVSIVLFNVSITTEEFNSILLENTRNELIKLYENHFFFSGDVIDLNANLNKLAISLKEKSQSQLFDLNYCFIASNKDNNFVLGNFTSRACNYEIDEVPISTLGVNKSTIINTTGNEIKLCDCNLSNDNIAINIKLSKGSSFVEWSN